MYCLKQRGGLLGDKPDCLSVISDGSGGVPFVSQVLTYIIMDLRNQSLDIRT